MAVGGWSLPVGGATYFLFSSLFREEVIDMVTYSDLILIGQLIVAVLNLFVHIYNNKKGSTSIVGVEKKEIVSSGAGSTLGTAFMCGKTGYVF